MKNLVCAGLLIPAFVLSADRVFGDVTVGGDRPVTIHVPPSYDPEVPVPLVLLLHGYTATGDLQELYLRFGPLANQRGFLFGHPEGMDEVGGTHDPCGTGGSGSRQFWNGTEGCDWNNSGIDDSEYLRRVIEEVRATFNLDRDRVYFVGHSCGGNMSHRMACDHSGTVAAIASLAGFTYVESADCGAASPVHVLEIRGTEDACVRYEGGDLVGNPYPGAVATVASWAEYNGCASELLETGERLDLDQGIAGAETRTERFESCTSGGEVELWTIEGAGHVPHFCAGHTVSGCPFLANGQQTSHFAIHVWDWLLRHPKRLPPEARFTIRPEGLSLSQEVLLDARGSTAPEGTTIVTYHWNLGDGNEANNTALVNHTYAHPGRFPVSLSVLTDDGRVSQKVTVPLSVSCPSTSVIPWVAADIGEPLYAGAARAQGSELREGVILCAGGKEIGTTHDGCLFLYQSVEGNFDIVAELSEMSGGEPRGEAGLMVRGSLEADAAMVAVVLERRGLTPEQTGRFRLRHRLEPGTFARRTVGDTTDKAAGWVRLQRRGTMLTAWSSTTGSDWQQIGVSLMIPELPGAVFAGAVAMGRDPENPGVSFEPLQARVSNLEILAPPRFLRGDCDGDGEACSGVNDALTMLSWIFLGGTPPPCVAACDANGTGNVDLTDAVYGLNFCFQGTAPPVAPYPQCGVGLLPGDELLGCVGSPVNCP